MISPSLRLMVAENFGSFICSPASSSLIGSSHTSISSVSMSARFFVCSKTKRAACSVLRPRRAVPSIIGIKSGRSNSADMSVTGWCRSSIRKSAIRKKFTRIGGQLRKTADGRTRTGTGLLSPTDFKSVASAISPHRRCVRSLSAFETSENEFLKLKLTIRARSEMV